MINQNPPVARFGRRRAPRPPEQQADQPESNQDQRPEVPEARDALLVEQEQHADHHEQDAIADAASFVPHTYPRTSYRANAVRTIHTRTAAATAAAPPATATPVNTF
jgi:hypothetical protein